MNSLSRSLGLPNTKKNAILLRIESAVLVKEGCLFDTLAARIEIEQNKVPIDFYMQSLDDVYKIDYSAPIKKRFFDSLDGTPTQPIWTTLYNNDYTNGDIWVPLEDGQNILTIKLISYQFVGYVNVDLAKDLCKPKSFVLSGTDGKKLEGSTLRFSYELGTQYEIEFRTGDEHFAPGTVAVFDSRFLNYYGKIGLLGGLYQTLKRFNPFHEDVNPEQDDKSEVMVQFNGSGSVSRFYQCKDGTNCSLKCKISQRDCFSSKFRLFVPLNVGLPLSLSVRLIANKDSKVTWFLENVILKVVGESNDIVMPCYQWITEGKMKSISLPFGLTPNMLKESLSYKRLHLERLNELEIAKSKYQWDEFIGIPSYLRGTRLGAYDLDPLEEQFDDYKTKDISYLISKSLQSTIVNTIMNKQWLNELKTVEDYQNLVLISATKPVQTMEKWDDDAFFGWTSITGTNPLRFQFCKTVPVQFLKEKDILKDVSSGNPISLIEECSKGRLYFVDYSGLAKYKLHTEGTRSAPVIQVGRKYAAPCVCLFYVGDDKYLRPVAIQLTPEGPIFTPRDSKWQWMYAKMAVRNADAQYHQVVDHYLTSHAVTETVSIALHRNVSRVHPIYRLLHPHLKYTIAINTIGRRSLVNPGGLYEQLTSVGEKFQLFLEDEYKTWDFSKRDLPSLLEERGFKRDNLGALTDFPFRDDGLLVWDAIFEYVGEYLSLYYKSSDDIINDTEVADWLRDLKERGYVERPVPGVKTKADLQKILSTIIWTASCHHSAVNFNQFNVYGFVPNSPLALYKPTPTSKDQIDEKFVVASLPGVKSSSVQIMLFKLLSEYAENEEYLTSKRYIDLIGEPKAKECLIKFQFKLREIDDVIKTRNEDRVKRGFSEYKLLMPSMVPNSVAI